MSAPRRQPTARRRRGGGVGGAARERRGDESITPAIGRGLRGDGSCEEVFDRTSGPFGAALVARVGGQSW